MRAEDEAEFREYVAGRWTWLVRAAMLLTGDPGHAEDLAQTALTRAFASWSRVRAAEDMDAYTMRILINQNKNRFRRRRVVEDLTADLAAVVPESGGADPTSRVDQRGIHPRREDRNPMSDEELDGSAMRELFAPAVADRRLTSA